MTEIIPSINAESFEEVKNKIKLVEPHVSWVHLDVADGTFTKNTTWHNPFDLNFLETKLNIEVHLMINEVEKRVGEWILPKVKRIFFHLSATAAPDFVIEQCLKNNIEPGIAIDPDEPIKFKEKIKTYQILGVHPGPAGQKTLEETFARIREVRKICDSCIIEVDGGMNKETIKRSIEAGANIIVAASAIFNSNNIEEAIHALE